MKNLIYALICLFLAIPCQARTITVDDDGPADFNNIQTAIDDANDYDTIMVYPGIYTGSGNRDIDISDKSITVRSTDPNDPDIVAATIIDCNGSAAESHRGFYYEGNSETHLLISGLTIINGYASSGGAIYYDFQSSGTSTFIIRDCIFSGNTGGYGGAIFVNSGLSIGAVITNCTFSNNTAADWGGAICARYGISINNCTFSGNTSNSDSSMFSGGGGIHCWTCIGTITNCTFTGNTANYGGAIGCFRYYKPTIKNCVLYGNTAANGNEIDLGFPMGFAYFKISYSNVEGGEAGVTGATDPLEWGEGNIDADPCFADPCNFDYHLQSASGRWDPNTNSWVVDANTSSCIDAGDPNSDWTAELWPHGKNINMGAYGGTPQASMSLSNVGNIADLDHNDVVNYEDLDLFTDNWPYQKILLAEDLDRNGVVDFSDFAIFADNWPWP